MNSLLKPLNHRLFPFAVISVLLLWRLLLWIDFPSPSADGVWYLGQTFALLRGHPFQVDFSGAMLGQYQYPYMFAVFTAPFYALFPSKIYGIFVYNVLVVALSCAFIYRYLKQATTFSPLYIGLILAAYLTGIYTFNLRPEMVIGLLMLMQLFALMYFQQRRAVRWLITAGVLTTLSGLNQPFSGGLFATYLGVAYGFQNRWRLRDYCLYVGAVAVSLLVLYGPLILVDYDHWYWQMFGLPWGRSFTFNYLSKYVIFSFPIYGLWGWAVLSGGNLKRGLCELIYIGLPLLSLIFLWQSYYGFPIFVVVLWRLSLLPEPRIPRWAVIPALVIAMSVSHIWPTIQQIENRDYVQTYQQLTHTLTAYAEMPTDELIWVRSSLSALMLYQPQARITDQQIPFPQRYLPASDGNILLFSQLNDYTVNRFDDRRFMFEIERLIEPASQGLLQISPFGERTTALGLWKLTAHTRRLE